MLRNALSVHDDVGLSNQPLIDWVVEDASDHQVVWLSAALKTFTRVKRVLRLNL